MSKNRIASRYLPERSFLYYRYPQGKISRPIDFYLPLLENINISESQDSNLITYDLVGRSGNLFSHTGAKSRKFSLTFNLSLLNIMDYVSVVGLNSLFSDTFKYFYSESTQKQRAKAMFRDVDFLGKPKKNLTSETAIDEWKLGSTKYSQLNIGNEQPSDGGPFSNLFKMDSTAGVVGQALSWLVGPKEPESNTLKKSINYFMLWLNVIRTSTINNSANTTFGPPSIYLTHGTMYKNIPCVCQSYSVKINNNAGYDLLTLNPRQVEITLSLLENRVGNFQQWKPMDRIAGENNTGWESVIEKRTMDPMNSPFDTEQMDAAGVTNLVSARIVRTLSPLTQSLTTFP